MKKYQFRKKIGKAYKALSNDKKMVARSFEVCGITTITDPSKMRSGEFYEQCMTNAKTILEDDVTEKDECQPF